MEMVSDGSIYLNDIEWWINYYLQFSRRQMISVDQLVLVIRRNADVAGIMNVYDCSLLRHLSILGSFLWV